MAGAAATIAAVVAAFYFHPAAAFSGPYKGSILTDSPAPRADVAASPLPGAPEPASTWSAAGLATATCTVALAAVLARGVLARNARPAAATSAAQCGERQLIALRAFENELGVQAPVGFWDPVGFTKDGDAAAFKRRRSTEIKHGRVSMLATMGYITPEVAGKFPGYLSPSKGLAYEDIPNGLAAISKVPFVGWLQIVLYCLYVEAAGLGFSYIGTEQTPGDVGWKPPLLSGFEGEARTKKLNAEIANGRLAMMAIIGMFFQDGLTGSAWGDWANYTDSPLRAFENELGVQPPAGFWDPAGFTKDGDAEAFKRRRETEIKHGRVSMLATMGYITPELVGKFPGELSPSLGLKYEDIPNGLAALSKVPGPGWLQIVAYCLYCESGPFGYNSDPNRKPGELGWRPIGLYTADPDLRQRRLNAEIANGRLAMMAIIGMFFQDGLTGSAWGDWANYTDSPLRAFENELGVQAPTGFWDPAGFTKDGDAAAFKRRRSTEIKHGRVSMLATMGYITPELVGKFPGYLSPSKGLAYEDIPNGLAAISKVPFVGWLQIILYCLYVEAAGLGFSYIGTEQTPGDVGWKPPLLSGFEGEARTKKLNAEIANGRLAMMAIIGMFFQDGLTGSAWGDWANYTDSPLRAFKNEFGGQPRRTGRRAEAEEAPKPPPFDPAKQVGAMEPLGFFDPAGFSKVGDEEGFRNLRVAELKHGRVAMMAALGFVAQQYIKLPGFEAVPAGVGAVTTPPGTYGFAALFLLAGALETAVWTESPDKEPGNFGDPVGLSNVFGYDEDMRNKEINNGRFAMFSAIGILSAELLTGKVGINQFQ